MNVHAIVRASFEKNSQANNDVRMALTGSLSLDRGVPFNRLGTGFYSATDKDAGEIAAALSRLAQVLAKHADTIDHFFISGVTNSN